MVADSKPAIVVLDPTEQAETVEARMAPRPSGLSGKTLGLLQNSKPHARELLDLVEQLLHERVQPGRVLRFSKPNSGQLAPQELIGEIVEQCDAVINGVGD